VIFIFIILISIELLEFEKLINKDLVSSKINK
jgi:hypothetical protein